MKAMEPPSGETAADSPRQIRVSCANARVATVAPANHTINNFLMFQTLDYRMTNTVPMRFRICSAFPFTTAYQSGGTVSTPLPSTKTSRGFKDE